MVAEKLRLGGSLALPFSIPARVELADCSIVGWSRGNLLMLAYLIKG